MKEYEVLIETINPCGGAKHSQKTFIEVETDSPEAYVKANSPYPILDQTEDKNGDTLINTGDGKGSFVKYTFTA